MLKFTSSNGEPTVLTTEIDIHERPGSENLTANRKKAEILGAKRVKRARMRSAFRPIHD